MLLELKKKSFFAHPASLFRLLSVNDMMICHTFIWVQVKKRGDDYEEIKQAIGHKMIEQACKLYPPCHTFSRL